MGHDQIPQAFFYLDPIEHHHGVIGYTRDGSGKVKYFKKIQSKVHLIDPLEAIRLLSELSWDT